MKKSRASLRFRIIIFVLTIFMITFAFFHSSMPADLSGEESESVTNFLQSIFDALGLNSQLTDHIVRKSAHFAEYTAIGMLLMSCAYSFNRKRPYTYSCHVLFVGLATAVCDETIQLNVAGRSGQITDVLLDFSGVLIGALIMLIIYTVYRRMKKL